MYSTRSGLILGFHGCDQSVVDQVINGQDCLKFSENIYDWLGHGIYFWDNSPSRAKEYAFFLKKENKVEQPAVIGAVIDLGFCLDLLDFDNLQLLKLGYEVLRNSRNSSEFPENKTGRNSNDLLLRNLDCAVINSLHEVRKGNEDEEAMQPFDSVRGVFWEGNDIYPNAGFKEKNHIQICVRNPNCIKGFFIPRELDTDHPKV
jgi:hypothetical protein